MLALVTSAYPSYSSCRQYRENLFDAAQGTTVEIERIRHYANHPGFVAASVDAVEAALDTLGEQGRERQAGLRHPLDPHRDGGDRGTRAAQRRPGRTSTGTRRVAAAVTRPGRRDAAASRTDTTWSTAPGPDRRASRGWSPTSTTTCGVLHAPGCPAVVLVPIGFISDHMEVIFDLDTEAAETAAELGLAFARAATAGVHPAFVAGLVDLMVERAAAARGENPDRPVVEGGVPGWYAVPARTAVPTCANRVGRR